MEERQENRVVLHGMYLFLVINATSLQLLPTTVIALRAASGSTQPEAILLPTLACTTLSTLVGVGCAFFCSRSRRASRTCRTAQKEKDMQVLQILLIPLLLLWLLVAAAWKRLPVYDLFLIGSKEGLQVALRVLPNLAAMMVAIGMFRV